MPDDALLPRDGPVLVGYDALQLPLLPHQITLKQVQRLGVAASGVKTTNINNFRIKITFFDGKLALSFNLNLG